MVWQELDPVGFIWDFEDRIYHVDCKDPSQRWTTAATAGSDRTSPGPTRAAGGTSSRPVTGTSRGRTPSARSTAIGYDGPISVEWEDAGMDRLLGAPEALEYVR